MNYYSEYLDAKLELKNLQREYAKLQEAYNDLRNENRALQDALDRELRDRW